MNENKKNENALCGAGYLELAEGETVAIGDQFYTSATDRWLPTQAAGLKVRPAGHPKHIRYRRLAGSSKPVDVFLHEIAKLEKKGNDPLILSSARMIHLKGKRLTEHARKALGRYAGQSAGWWAQMQEAGWREWDEGMWKTLEESNPWAYQNFVKGKCVEEAETKKPVNVIKGVWVYDFECSKCGKRVTKEGAAEPKGEHPYIAGGQVLRDRCNGAWQELGRRVVDPATEKVEETMQENTKGVHGKALYAALAGEEPLEELRRMGWEAINGDKVGLMAMHDAEAVVYVEVVKDRFGDVGKFTLVKKTAMDEKHDAGIPATEGVTIFAVGDLVADGGTEDGRFARVEGLLGNGSVGIRYKDNAEYKRVIRTQLQLVERADKVATPAGSPDRESFTPETKNAGFAGSVVIAKGLSDELLEVKFLRGTRKQIEEGVKNKGKWYSNQFIWVMDDEELMYCNPNGDLFKMEFLSIEHNPPKGGNSTPAFAVGDMVVETPPEGNMAPIPIHDVVHVYPDGGLSIRNKNTYKMGVLRPEDATLVPPCGEQVVMECTTEEPESENIQNAPKGYRPLRHDELLQTGDQYFSKVKLPKDANTWEDVSGSRMNKLPYRGYQYRRPVKEDQKKATDVDAGKGYRLLAPEEMIIEGDAYKNDGDKWQESVSVGTPVGIKRLYRRRIQPADESEQRIGETREEWRARTAVKTEQEPDAGEGYRILESRELLVKGDEFYNKHKKWLLSTRHPGSKAGDWRTYRRRIEPGETQPQDALGILTGLQEQNLSRAHRQFVGILASAYGEGQQFTRGDIQGLIAIGDNYPALDTSWWGDALWMAPTKQRTEKQTAFAQGDSVIVYDRYRFAVPLRATVATLSRSNDGVEVCLQQSNSAQYPVGALIWVSAKQLRHNEPTTQKENAQKETRCRLLKVGDVLQEGDEWRHEGEDTGWFPVMDWGVDKVLDGHMLYSVEYKRRIDQEPEPKCAKEIRYVKLTVGDTLQKGDQCRYRGKGDRWADAVKHMDEGTVLTRYHLQKVEYRRPVNPTPTDTEPTQNNDTTGNSDTLGNSSNTLHDTEGTHAGAHGGKYNDAFVEDVVDDNVKLQAKAEHQKKKIAEWKEKVAHLEGSVVKLGDLTTALRKERDDAIWQEEERVSKQGVNLWGTTIADALLKAAKTAADTFELESRFETILSGATDESNRAFADKLQEKEYPPHIANPCIATMVDYWLELMAEIQADAAKHYGKRSAMGYMPPLDNLNRIARDIKNMAMGGQPTPDVGRSMDYERIVNGAETALGCSIQNWWELEAGHVVKAVLAQFAMDAMITAPHGKRKRRKNVVDAINVLYGTSVQKIIQYDENWAHRIGNVTKEGVDAFVAERKLAWHRKVAAWLSVALVVVIVATFVALYSVTHPTHKAPEAVELKEVQGGVE